MTSKQRISWQSEARRMLAGGAKQVDVARHFNVSKPVIWKLANPEKAQAARQLYYKRNREKMKAYSLAYYYRKKAATELKVAA